MFVVMYPLSLADWVLSDHGDDFIPSLGPVRPSNYPTLFPHPDLHLEID